MFKAWNLEVVSIKGMSASSPVSSCSALSTIKHHMLYRRAIHVVDPCHRKKYSSRCQTQVWHDVLEGWHRKKSHPNTFPHTAPWEFPRGPRNWTEGWSGVKNLTGTFWSLLLKLLKILNPKTDVIMCMYIYNYKLYNVFLFVRMSCTNIIQTQHVGLSLICLCEISKKEVSSKVGNGKKDYDCHLRQMVSSVFVTWGTSGAWWRT